MARVQSLISPTMRALHRTVVTVVWFATVHSFHAVTIQKFVDMNTLRY